MIIRVSGRGGMLEWKLEQEAGLEIHSVDVNFGRRRGVVEIVWNGWRYRIPPAETSTGGVALGEAVPFQIDAPPFPVPGGPA